jgi:alkanesulfonate monooxygenase SsuD/methylene tetrahydromethanopterin reductase-like flavin-dependent oxidoreductase (luciferase family)
VFECWTTIAAISQLTTASGSGRWSAATSYRNPALLAKITSTVDVISGGRLDWGIGAGWYENEYRGYGYEFPQPEGAHRHAAEAVEIVRSMWTEPETTYNGTYYELSRPTAIPSRCRRRTRRSGSAAAASSSRCGSSPATPTARTSAAARAVGAQARGPAEHCAAVGRDPDEIRMTWSPEVFIRRTRTSRRRRHRSLWGEPSTLAAGNLVGTPEQVAEKVQTYLDLGCAGSSVVRRLPRHRIDGAVRDRGRARSSKTY